MKKTMRNIVSGVRGGMYLACIAAAFALVVYVFRGQHLLDTYRVTLLQMLGGIWSRVLLAEPPPGCSFRSDGRLLGLPSSVSLLRFRCSLR